MKSEPRNRNSVIAAKTFPHADIVRLDSDLRSALHGQPDKFPLSAALHASAKLGTKSRSLGAKREVAAAVATQLKLRLV